MDLDFRHTILVLGRKWRMAHNSISRMRSHMYVHFAVGLLMVFMLVGGGTLLFRSMFRFLMRLEVFGPILMDQLVSLVLLIFFALLIFSNLIITLSTTYISREVEFLMAQPMSRQAIFRLKLTESVIFSSWAFALLSLPLFVSYGMARNVEWYFYPLVLLLVIPFLLIPAGLGALITMILTAYIPARRTRTLSIGIGIAGAVASYWMGRGMGIGRLLRTAENQDFGQVLSALTIGSSPWLPSAWMGKALRAIGPADRTDIDLIAYLYWFGMILATALFLLEVTRWLVPSLYYKGWCLSRDNAVQKEAKLGGPRRSVFTWLDRPLSIFGQPVKALLSKDLKTFWRDPAQWTQLVVLVGLMAVYLSNLRNVAKHSDAVSFILGEWRAILVIFNLAASCFILSILTTRFVYPMLSLEGRGFWTVGLAPIPRARILWQKYLLCLGTALLISHSLTWLSNRVLAVGLDYRILSHATITVLSLGLTSLSIGLGAILPNFKEDNPARIANGIGGTLNVILSLSYIGATVAILVLPVVLWPRMDDELAQWQRWGWPLLALMVVLQLAAAVLPMRIGLRRWQNHEF